MTLREEPRSRLVDVLRECRLHIRRIDHAREALQLQLPISGADWQRLDDDAVGHIDQLLFRFGKLQDAMGRRLFPLMLKVLAELDEAEPFIDKLNRLEKLGLIPSARQWVEWRELRNQATHEYPDAPEQNAENLNLILEALPRLESVFELVATHALRYLESGSLT